MTIGEKIKFYRTGKKLTQKELAIRCGLAESTVKQYEYGLRNPKTEAITKIAEALGVSVAELLENTTSHPFSREEIESIFVGATRADLTRTPLENRLWDSYDKLNPDGQEEAVKRVEELAELPKYKK